MADFRLSALADHDLENIYIHTARHFGERQADAYLKQLHHSAGVAASFPRIGKEYITKSGDEFRQYYCGRHTIFYRIETHGIFIVRILHVNMDISRHLG